MQERIPSIGRHPFLSGNRGGSHGVARAPARRRLPDGAHVPARGRRRARQGPEGRGHEIPRGEGASRGIPARREGPLDPEGVDPAGPRSGLARPCGRVRRDATRAGLGDDVFRELFPKDGAEWIEIPVQAFAGISPTVKLERGVFGPYRVGIVPEPRLRSLYDWAAKTKFNAPPAAISVLGEVEALSAAARRGAGPSVAVVFAGYSFEDVAAE